MSPITNACGAVRERERPARDLGTLTRPDGEGAAEAEEAGEAVVGELRARAGLRVAREQKVGHVVPAVEILQHLTHARQHFALALVEEPRKLLAVDPEKALDGLLVRGVADARERRLRDRVVGQARGRHPLEARAHAAHLLERRLEREDAGARGRQQRPVDVPEEGDHAARRLPLGERRLRGLLERAGEPHRVRLGAVDEHGRARARSGASPRGGSATIRLGVGPEARAAPAPSPGCSRNESTSSVTP